MKSKIQLFLEDSAQSALSIAKVLIASKFRSPLPSKTSKDCIILANGPSLKSSLAKYNHIRDKSKYDFFCVNQFANTDFYEQMQPNYYVLNAPEYWVAEFADIANIIRNDNAFATCQVEHAWKWLIGRVFHSSESKIRAALTNYFITTNYSFRELVYAIATHPTFLEGSRGNGLVDDPLTEPPLGEPPGGNELPECNTKIDFATDIQPLTSACTSCHSGTNSLSALVTEADWDRSARSAISMMTSGEMPPGQTGPPRIGPNYEFKEKVRCWVERDKQ